MFLLSPGCGNASEIILEKKKEKKSPSFYDYTFNTIQVLAKMVRSLIRVSSSLPALVPGTLMIITKKKSSGAHRQHHNLDRPLRSVFTQAVIMVKWITFGGRASRLLNSLPPDFGKSFPVKFEERWATGCEEASVLDKLHRLIFFVVVINGKAMEEQQLQSYGWGCHNIS